MYKNSLREAVTNGYHAIALALLDKGANVNAKDDYVSTWYTIRYENVKI